MKPVIYKCESFSGLQVNKNIKFRDGLYAAKTKEAVEFLDNYIKSGKAIGISLVKSSKKEEIKPVEKKEIKEEKKTEPKKVEKKEK